MGKWVAAAGKWFGNEAEDRGLMTSEIMKFYGIAAPFESFSNEGKELIIQYQAKYEKDLGCGGGYLKIGPKQADLTTFGEPTPYNIMFGPDQCNTDKRTHLIFSYKGKNFLKKTELDYKQVNQSVSHLYRLVVKPDSTVRVEVDQEKLYEGSLKEDWDLLPTKEIVDPNDKKPEGWVDEAEMVDPKNVKPGDWVDEKRIQDPEAKKPEDWDDEEDGEYEAPHIDNPAFKGEWTASKVPNPAYKGAWEAKKIPNPDFEDDPAVYKYPDFGYVGFDIYQVKGGTIFDNIIITDDVAAADEFAKKWKTLSDAEQKQQTTGEVVADAAFEKFRAARTARNEAAKAAKKEACLKEGRTDCDEVEKKEEEEQMKPKKGSKMPEMPGMPGMPEGGDEEEEEEMKPKKAPKKDKKEKKEKKEEKKKEL